MQSCLLLLLCVLVFATGSELLLIVGDVTHNSVRVLYEPQTQQDSVQFEVTLFKTSYNFQNAQQMTSKTVTTVANPKTKTFKPKIVTFENLETGQAYLISFKNGKFVDNATFTTFSPNNQKLKFLAVACDRYFDDKDDSYWKHLLETEKQTYHGIIHMGDQIYADRPVREMIAKGVTDEEEMRETFRNVYRKTWSHPSIRSILRHGAHWMFPDDHDILNNLDREYTNSTFSKIMTAGRQVYFEYQYALHADYDQMAHIYYWRQVNDHTVFLYLDTRFERTFSYDSEHTLVGKTQFESFKQALEHYGQNEKVTNMIVFTSVPLAFYSEQMAKIVYKVEKERYPNHPDLLDDTIRLLELMKPYSDKITLLSGDIHQYVESRICQGEKCIKQYVSSGMTQGSTVIHETKLFLFFTVGKYFTNHLLGQEYGKENQWNMIHEKQVYTLNYAVLEFDNDKLNVYGVFPNDLTTDEQIKMFVLDYFPHLFGSLVAMIVFIIMRVVL